MKLGSVSTVFIFILLLIMVRSEKSDIKIIAHRGGSNLAPENTMAAFQNALNLGVDMIEIDIEQTIDSVVVVIHDTKVDRTTNGKGKVDSLTYSYIKTLDAGSWYDSRFKGEKISTLEEVLQSVNGKATVLIEIKSGDERYQGIEKRTVEAIQHFNAHSWTIVQSFNKKTVERVKILDNKIVTYYLLGRNFMSYYHSLQAKIKKNKIQEFLYDGIAVHYSMLNAASVDSVKQMGLGVFTWTVDEEDDMTKMIEFGVDGIITDSPDKLIGLIESMKTK